MLDRSKHDKRFRAGGRALALVTGGALCVSAFMAALVLRNVPSAGARAADLLRSVAGDEAVAHLESAVYGAKDKIDQQAYALGLKKADAPWDVSAPSARAMSAPTAAIALPKPGSSARATAAKVARASGGSTDTVARTNLRAALAAEPRDTATTSGASPAPDAVWRPRDVPAFGTTAGEGHWLPYLTNGQGDIAAYRTFVNPDPQRPYAAIGIVAFDLTRTRLNFVLGSQEPKSAVKIERPGTIPAADSQAGKLLAVFNGGWKAQHGHFGVGVGATTVLSPVNGIATVALQDDGRVRMGVWGTDVITDAHTLAWRQNNVPLIHDGDINPRTANMSIADWGSALNGNVAVWRSALGISRDGRTLYYAAGDSALVASMAAAMHAVGAYQAMQLDVNNYWVHFDAVRGAADGGLKPEALFAAMGMQDDNRYLKGFTRDFFYVTAN